MPFDAPDQIQAAQNIERKIADIIHARNMLQNKAWGVSIREEDRRLAAEERKLTERLYEIRPYSVFEHGVAYLVSHNGDFVMDEDGDDWIRFEARGEAEAFIAELEAA